MPVTAPEPSGAQPERIAHLYYKRTLYYQRTASNSSLIEAAVHAECIAKEVIDA